MLHAQDGSNRSWSKTYEAPIFLAMDCLDLGLVDEAPTLDDDLLDHEGMRLRTEGEVSLERVRHCRFEEFPSTEER